jgi:hypothetical protein
MPRAGAFLPQTVSKVITVRREGKLTVIPCVSRSQANIEET